MPNTNFPQMLIAVPYLAWSTSVCGRYALHLSRSRMIVQKKAYDSVEAAGNMAGVFLRSLGNWTLGGLLLTAKENSPFSWIRAALGPWWTRDVWLTIQWLRNWRRVQKFLTTLPNMNFVNTMQKRPCIFAGIKNQISFKLGLWFLPDLYVYFSLILIPSDLQVPLLHCTCSIVNSLLAIILIATENVNNRDYLHGEMSPCEYFFFFFLIRKPRLRTKNDILCDLVYSEAVWYCMNFDIITNGWQAVQRHMI